MEKHWGMAINVDSCFGCKFCVIACKSENHAQLISCTGEIVEEDTAFQATVREETSGNYPRFIARYYPVFCRHCQNPVCRESCPTNAISRRDDGIVVISQKDCNGCDACITACPYHIPQHNPQTGRLEMCHFCAHRLEEGKEPMCVQACPVKALVFGDLNDKESEISQLVESRKTLESPEDSNISPSVYLLTRRERPSRV